jgi:hypothetical protein
MPVEALTSFARNPIQPINTLRIESETAVDIAITYDWPIF